MEEVLTAPYSPWQNPYAERLVGTLRRESLNHFVILNALHLRRILTLYFRYYQLPELTSDWLSSARFRGRYQALEGLLKSRRSVVSITATMSGFQPNPMPPGCGYGE